MLKKFFRKKCKDFWSQDQTSLRQSSFGWNSCCCGFGKPIVDNTLGLIHVKVFWKSLESMGVMLLVCKCLGIYIMGFFLTFAHDFSWHNVDYWVIGPTQKNCVYHIIFHPLDKCSCTHYLDYVYTQTQNDLVLV